MSERLFGIRPLLAVAGLAGLAAALGLYGFGLGTGTARVSDSRAKVQATAQAFAAARDPSGARRTVIVRSLGDTDDDAERFARTYGVDQLAEAERDGAFVLRTWDARLRTNAVTSDYEDDPDSARVTLDRTGRVVGFESKPGGDSASAPSRDQARQIAADGLKQLGISLDGFVEPTQKTSVAANVKVGTGGGLQTEVVESNDSDNDANDAERPGKSVQKFVWKRSDDRWPGLEQKVSASVTGAGLTDFSVTSEFETEQLQTRIVAAVAEATLFGVLTTGLILILLGAMLSRVISRDYVSLSRAALIAGVYAATVALAAVVTFTGKNSVVENYLGQTFAALGMAILIGAGWIAGEADAYYAWGRRSTEAALALATGSPMARQVAREVVEGFLWGWLLLGALALAAAIVAALNGGNGVFVDRELSPFDAGAIPLFWTTTLPFVGFYAVCLLLFVPAWLHRLTKRAWLAIPIAGVIASVFASTLNIADVRFGALPGTLSWALVFGISTCALAARRGWLTGAVATFAFSAFFWGTAALKKHGPQAAGKSLVERMFGWLLPGGLARRRLSRLDMGGLGRLVMAREMRRKQVADLDELVAIAAGSGVRIFLCDTSMNLMGIRTEELIEYPDMQSCGVARFLELAGESQTTMFI